MQTLWTRVAQVRGSCRCPQCLSSANGVSRRATGTATRRMPQYLTSSTLWYSGIFAAAATFDAAAKKDRREQWDRAIADVKNQLGQHAEAYQDQSFAALSFPEAAQDEITGAEAQYKPFKILPEDEEVFHDINARRTKPRWPANTGPALKLTHLPPESIYATAQRNRRLKVTPLSPKKVAEVEVALEILLLDLFVELHERNWSLEASKAVPEEFAKNILQDLSELFSRRNLKYRKLSNIRNADATLSDYQPWKYDHTSLCSFRQDELRDSNRAVRDLNTSLLELFRLQANDKISRPSLLAKLAHNVSLCTGPPNLRTFNTLLLGFSAMDERFLVDRVIKSTGRAHMRPNEITLATILKHYTKTNRPDIFVTWIERMRGKHGGLYLARPDITITDHGRSRLIPTPEQPERIVQLPYATPFVFGPLINGVIKFAGFETALAVCQKMGLEGWGLCMSGLTPLLQNCAERADWTSGLAIWNQIQAIKAISRRKTGARWMTERIGLETFAAMLRLCSRCDKKEYFESVWDTAIKIYEKSTDELVCLVKGGNDNTINFDFDSALDERQNAEFGPTLSTGTQSETIAEHNELDLVSHAENRIEADSPSYARHIQAASELVDDVRRTADELNDIPSRLRQDDKSHISRYMLTSQRKTLKPAKLKYPTFPSERSELLEEQLWGLLPASDEMSAYELQERPMALSQ